MMGRDIMTNTAAEPYRIRVEEREAGSEKSCKVYVDVVADFSADGFLRPLLITWKDGRRYHIDRVRKCERAASRKAGGVGLLYFCDVCGKTIHLYYEENYRWFVEAVQAGS